MSRDREVLFTALIYKVGVLRCVDIPQRAARALSAVAKMPVRASTAAGPFETALAPRKDGGFRLFVRMALLRSMQLDVGDRLSLKIRADATARKKVMPADFARALRATPGARQAFSRLSPSARRQFIEWLDDAKKAETRQRRMRKAVQMVVDQARRRESASLARFF